MDLKTGLLRLAIGATVVAAIFGFLLAGGSHPDGFRAEFGLVVAGVFGGIVFVVFMLIRWIVLGFRKDK